MTEPPTGHLASARSTPPLLLPLLFFLLATILTSCAEGALVHKGEPEIVFSAPRPATPPTMQGNGIQASPDGALLYTTSADGTLTALDALSGQVRFTIQPRPRDDDWTTECSSGIALHHDGNDDDGSVSDYLVYAIIDVPPPSSLEKVSSRIFAVDVEDTDDGVLRWVTSPIPGRIAGTPAIDSSGLYVYYVHNEQVGAGNGDIVGHFSIVNDPAEGELLYTAPSPNNDAFAPLGIAHNPMRGNYEGGEGNTNDLLVWGTDSPFPSGHTYAFQLPANFRKGSRNTRLFEIVTLQKVNWATSNAPALSRDGDGLYFATASSGVSGWTSDPFDSGASWERNMNVIPAPLVLSEDGTTLFVATNNAFQALNSETGVTRWKIRQLGGQILSRSAVSRDGERVYFAEKSGTVYSADNTNGGQTWALEMDGDVVSDLALSLDSTTLYVVTSDGYVSGIKVAEDDGRSTARPTRRPAFMEPTPNIATPAPSKRPSRAPTKRPSPAPSNPLPTRAPPTRLPPTIRPPTPIPPTPAPEARPSPAVATSAPQARPTRPPVRNPTNGNIGDRPTYEPTLEPTLEIQPSPRPTTRPTRSPVVEETLPPSAAVFCQARFSIGFAVVALAFLIH